MDREPRTLADVFTIGADRHPRPDRFLRKAGGAWHPVSTEAFARGVRSCAAALASIGVGRGDRVAILSYNRLEWAQADYACQLLGAADVPVYATLPADQAAFIVRDSGAKAAFVENAEQAAKVAGVVPHAVSFDPAPGIEPFEAFLKRGSEPPAATVRPDDLATLIYTSGTSGVPKGVMLTHGNIVSNLLASCAAIDCRPDDLLLSFLPLSHSFERIFDYALFWTGASIAHAEHVDKVGENLLEVRPTIMGAVPRFYEKVYGKIRKSVAEQAPWKRRLFEWARAAGAVRAEFVRRGAPVPFGAALRHRVGRALVLDRLAARVGGRIRLFVSGGGALDRDVAEFFWSLGLPVYEGYGLTETSPVLTINRPGEARLGTVGRPIRGVELRIAEDGEILARGPNIMRGYFNLPGETAQALRDGWLLTGDVGEIDADGYLRITDRKKDLFKTSGGKYVAPQPIENRLKLHPAVVNAVVIGDRRKFPSALIVPARGAPAEQVQAAVDAVNAGLAHHEQIKKFALLDRDFTIEDGELTPSLKVRRRAVEQKHAARIDAMYAD